MSCLFPRSCRVVVVRPSLFRNVVSFIIFRCRVALAFLDFPGKITGLCANVADIRRALNRLCRNRCFLNGLNRLCGLLCLSRRSSLVFVQCLLNSRINGAHSLPLRGGGRRSLTERCLCTSVSDVFHAALCALKRTAGDKAVNGIRSKANAPVFQGHLFCFFRAVAHMDILFPGCVQLALVAHNQSVCNGVCNGGCHFFGSFHAALLQHIQHKLFQRICLGHVEQAVNGQLFHNAFHGTGGQTYHKCLIRGCPSGNSFVHGVGSGGSCQQNTVARCHANRAVTHRHTEVIQSGIQVSDCCVTSDFPFGVLLDFLRNAAANGVCCL